MGIVLFFALSFILAFVFAGPKIAIGILIIQLLCFFLDATNRSQNKEKKRIKKAYEKEKELHPEIIDRNHIEKLARERLMRGKLIRAGVFFGIGVLLIVGTGILSGSKEDALVLVGKLGILVGFVCLITAVLIFAKAMHDPLTENEAKELAQRETEEKTGGK